MDKIVKKNGYVYWVTGDKGFETYYNLGKDPDSPIWDEKPKKKNKKKELD